MTVPLCPLHCHLTLAGLLLSCAVHVITVLTLHGELIVPKNLPQPARHPARAADHWALGVRAEHGHASDEQTPSCRSQRSGGRWVRTHSRIEFTRLIM